MRRLLLHAAKLRHTCYSPSTALLPLTCRVLFTIGARWALGQLRPIQAFFFSLRFYEALTILLASRMCRNWLTSWTESNFIYSTKQTDHDRSSELALEPTPRFQPFSCFVEGTGTPLADHVTEQVIPQDRRSSSNTSRARSSSWTEASMVTLEWVVRSWSPEWLGVLIVLDDGAQLPVGWLAEILEAEHD